MDSEKTEMRASEKNEENDDQDKTLNWMYKRQQEINRDDYLTGKKIDKAFEQFAQAEREKVQNKASSNHVEYDCVPPSLRSYSCNEQVDMARKLQEDPLYIIKKKEMESRAQLLKNPVKLKQLKELVSKRRKSPEPSSKPRSSKSDRDSSYHSKKEDDRRKPQKKAPLTEKEKLKKLKEMMANAAWRDKDRIEKVKRFREQAKKEESQKEFSPNFLKAQLAKAAEGSTVAGRIKSKMNNIQRSKSAMETNFAKR